MTNFLEEAMRQEELPQKEESLTLEDLETGGSLFWKSGPPDPPKSIGEGEFRFSPSPSPTHSTTKGGGAAAPLSLETSPGFSVERKSAPSGLDGWGVLTNRVQAPKSEGQGHEVVRTAEIPLLSALRRAERAAAFVRGPRRNWTITLPEAAGESGGGFTLEELDRAVERDARRYGGGSVFY